MTKYHSKKVEYNGIKFDSKLECNVYKVLSDYIIELQPKFVLQDKFMLDSGKLIRAITYKADFKVKIGDEIYIVDAKGMETPGFKLKHKMYMNIYRKEVVLLKSMKQAKEWLEQTKGGLDG